MSPLSATSVAALSDAALAQYVEGDDFAWTQLYAVHGQTARSFLRRLGVPSESLDDACQEVFLEVFRYLGRFRGESSFKTWLYRLCITQARRFRRRRHVIDTLGRLLSWEPPSYASSKSLDSDRAEQLVEGALNQLNEGERLVFVLYELEGASGSEIASVAACPEATVWRRLHYARKKFTEYVRSCEDQS
ncbi:MAG TPA: RNA polymerase sigma factor [Polyangiaceae bacterium]|nr:RNA polymerase sigma factor [Polyangiaceae bacterium]